MRNFGMTALCAALFIVVAAGCEAPVMECDQAECQAQSDGGVKSDATPANTDGSATCKAADPAKVSSGWTPCGDGLSFYPQPGTVACRSWDAWGTTVQTWSGCQLSLAANTDGLNGWVIARGACSVSCDIAPLRCSDISTSLREWLPQENTLGEYVCAVGTDSTTPPPANGPCSGKAAGYICRDSAGKCDLAEVCDGSSSQCPSDRLAASGTACQLSDGSAGTCNGSSAACQSGSTDLCANVSCANGLVCDPTNGQCTVPSLVTCHGLVVEDPGTSAGQCIWYARTPGVALGVFTSADNVRVVGPDGACSVVCQNAPTLCSGTWMNDHVQTWSSVGGTLPAGGIGCAWDNKHTH